jgi:beta-carotene ketolase (CrtO type)
MYDAIIVGGGPNGLTCGAFLARAGRRVLVVEQREIVGGFATTEELMPDAPGFRCNKHAIDLFTCMIPRSIVDDLELGRFGFRTVVTDPYATYLSPSGASICQWRDVERTAAEVARLSRRDAERYRRFAQVLGEAWNAALPYLQGHPRRMSAGALLETIVRAAKGRRSLAPAARILVSSPAQVLEEWFERDELKVILGTWAAAIGQVPLDVPGAAAGMAMAVLSHRWGCFRPVGGMGTVTGALAECLKAHGGEVRTGARVERIIVAGGRADGVVLAGGEELHAREVIGAIDPAALFERLVPRADLPDGLRDELQAMRVCDQNVTYFTGHAALSRRPTLPRHGREEAILRAGYQILVPSYESLNRSLADASAGRMPQDIPIWLSYPSVCDRSLVPPGSEGETLYFMSPVTPYRLADGREWSQAKDEYLRRALDIVETYTAGVKEATIATAGVTPQDMATLATKGHGSHVDVTLAQMGPWRPTPSLAGFTTPIESLWHVSAGAHPFSSVHGWGARSAARAVLTKRAGSRVPRRAVLRTRPAAGGPEPAPVESQMTVGTPR